MTALPLSNEKYQVYFFSSRAHKPLHFAVHLWVVTVGSDGIQRFEVLKHKRSDIQRYGHVHINFYPPTRGLRMMRGSEEFWESKLLGQVVGSDNSLAERMHAFIHRYSADYLHKDSYRTYPGPNSNTYIAWIISKFPEARITLPWNAFGKSYLK